MTNPAVGNQPDACYCCADVSGTTMDGTVSGVTVITHELRVK